MKAIALTHYLPSDHPHCFIETELPDPTPGPRDLLVRVAIGDWRLEDLAPGEQRQILVAIPPAVPPKPRRAGGFPPPR